MWEICLQPVSVHMYLLQVKHISELLIRFTGLCYDWFIYSYKGDLIFTTNRFIVKGNWGMFLIVKHREMYF